LASLRPSQMEAKGVAVVQRGTGDGVLRKEAALLRQGTAKVRDDEQESGIRRTYRDESAPQGSETEAKHRGGATRSSEESSV